MPQSKSLLLSIGYFPDIGGIQKTQYELVKRLGIDSVIIARHTKGCEESDNKQKQEIIRVKTGKMKKGFYYLSSKICSPLQMFLNFRGVFKSVIKNYDIGVVICSHIATGLLALKSKKKTGIPYVIFAHGQEVFRSALCGKNSISYRCAKEIFNNASIIYVSNNFTKGIVETWLYDKSKVKKIPFVGADTKRFFPKKKNNKTIKKFGLEENKVLLTVTRLDDYKGVDFVIKSLPLIIKEIPNIRYIVVGTGTEMEKLKQLTKEIGVEKHVIFTGNIDESELNDYYNLCDVFIMCSRDCVEKSPICSKGGMVEGFGVVFIEANACEKPVIGGNSGGIPDAVIDGKTGLLVNPIDINDIKEKIVKLLTNKKYADELGKNGRKRAIEELNYKQAADIVTKDLKKLIGVKNEI